MLRDRTGGDAAHDPPLRRAAIRARRGGDRRPAAPAGLLLRPPGGPQAGKGLTHQHCQWRGGRDRPALDARYRVVGMLRPEDCATPGSTLRSKLRARRRRSLAVAGKAWRSFCEHLGGDLTIVVARHRASSASGRGTATRSRVRLTGAGRSWFGEPGGGVHLTYCSNIHPASSGPRCANIDRHAGVKDRLLAGWSGCLSARAAAELSGAMASNSGLPLARERPAGFNDQRFPTAPSTVRTGLPDWSKDSRTVLHPTSWST